MIKQVMHIGITVSDIERSISFYRDVLGLKFKGQILMEGSETDALFKRKNCRAKVAYLNGSENLFAPPVELIQFVDEGAKERKSDLFSTSISEICFMTDNIEKDYENLVKNNVECLSRPQSFDFSDDGFGKSKAIYFKDPDGIILELMEVVE